jgi:hypothetical protein
VDTRLISPPFMVPASSPTLHFWQWYSFNNALGFVEINNGATINTSITNITITTNVSGSLDTNIDQLFGALNTNYSTPFYWNQTNGWTNAATTKVLGNVLDMNFGTPYFGLYYFEGGTAPLSSVGTVGNVDYRGANNPVPQSAAATNFLAWQGMTWNSPVNGSDNPVGLFGTNTVVTYTTNITVTTTESSWTQVSPSYFNTSSGTWINTALDLSAFAGQPVQIAFHFTSGGIYTAPGWYVDDLGLASAPTLLAPTNEVINYGQKFTNSITATNSIEPDSIFTFALAAASTNVVVKTNGLVIWTSTKTPPGTYTIYVQVTDNNTPPFSLTNSFSVTVLPLPSQLILSKALTVGHDFKFSIKSPWTNDPWLIVATTNLDTAATNWLPIYTNLTGHAGTLMFTDRLATNFLQRYYRAVFP